MTEIKTYCDHCGTELNPHNDYEDTYIDIAGYLKQVDLCGSCFNELITLIEKFVEKGTKDTDMNVTNEERNENGNYEEGQTCDCS